MVEEEDDEVVGLETAVNGNGHFYAEQNRQLSPTARPVTGNGLHSNGRIHQPSLFSNGRVKADAATTETHRNGQTCDKDETSKPIPIENNTLAPPPVPRPRLLIR